MMKSGFTGKNHLPEIYDLRTIRNEGEMGIDINIRVLYD